MTKIYSTLLSLLTATSLHAQTTPTWTLVHQDPADNFITISAPTATTCYAGGYSGLLKKTTDGGYTWHSLVSGTSDALESLCFTDSIHGYAVGSSGSLIRTTDGGATWTSQTPVIDSPSFNHIWFLDAATGFITGMYPGPSSQGIFLKTTDSGATWTSFPFPAIDTRSIFFTSADNGYVATTYDMYKTTDGGASWTGNHISTSPLIAGLCFTDSTTGFASGLWGSLFKTTDAGTTWTNISPGISGDMSSIDFYDPGNGFIATGITTTHYSYGSMYRTTDGGATWTNCLSINVPPLIGLDMVNSITGYALGYNGTILKYTPYVGIQEHDIEQPLTSAYPNPFSKSTVIDCGSYAFKHTVSLEIYTMDGRLVDSKSYPANSSIRFENESLGTGVYFYKVYDGPTPVGKGKLAIIK